MKKSVDPQNSKNGTSKSISNRTNSNSNNRNSKNGSKNKHYSNSDSNIWPLVQGLGFRAQGWVWSLVLGALGFEL